MTTELDDLLSTSEYVLGRTMACLDGPTDDELLWEPVPGCWSVRPRRGGRSAVVPYLEPRTPV